MRKAFGAAGFGAAAARLAPRSLGKPTPSYPGAIATDAQLAIAVDRLQTMLAATLSDIAISMTVASAAGIVADMLLSIGDEIVRVTAAPTGTSVPIARGFDGTIPAVHLSGATVSGLIDAYHHNALVSEIQAIESALGPNLSKIPGKEIIPADSTNFPAQAPGGALTVGTNSITLTPVPDGVNGTNTEHWLWISGGAGAAEAVKITGGNAVAGAPTGQIFVTCANAHTGAWTIQSATAGIQEALYHSIALGPSVVRAIVMPTATSYLYAKITFPIRDWFPGFTLIGNTEGVPALIRDAAYPNGDLFLFEATTAAQGSLRMSNIWILNEGGFGSPINTGGAAIHVKGNTAGHIVLEDISIYTGFRGIDIDGCGSVTIRNAFLSNTGAFAAALPSDSGIYIHDSTGNKNPSDIHIHGGFIGGAAMSSANLTRYGILIEAADGVKIESVNIIQVQNAIWFNANTNQGIAVININDSIFDSFANHAIAFAGSATAMANIVIDNNWIAVRSDIYPAVPSNEAIFLAAGCSVTNLQITNNVLGVCRLAGFKNAGALTGLQLLNNLLYGCNMANVANEASISLGPNTVNYMVCNNRSGNLSGGGAADHSKYGLTVAAGTSNGVVTGNDFTNNETAPLLLQGNPAGFILRDNLGIDNVIGSVASAAIVSFPLNRQFALTGTVNVAAVNALWAGAGGSLVTPDGAVTFTAGATIANTITTVPNRPVTWWSDGTRVYIGP